METTATKKEEREPILLTLQSAGDAVFTKNLLSVHCELINLSIVDEHGNLLDDDVHVEEIAA